MPYEYRSLSDGRIHRDILQLLILQKHLYQSEADCVPDKYRSEFVQLPVAQGDLFRLGKLLKKIPRDIEEYLPCSLRVYKFLSLGLCSIRTFLAGLSDRRIPPPT